MRSYKLKKRPAGYEVYGRWGRWRRYIPWVMATDSYLGFVLERKQAHALARSCGYA